MSKVSLKLQREKTVFEPIHAVLEFTIESQDELDKLTDYFGEISSDSDPVENRLLGMITHKLATIKESL